VTVDEVKSRADAIRAQIGKAVVGQAETVDLMLTALIAGGHVLLEGPPGTAKTFLAQCFAHTLTLDFGRVQFTPDLMPADIVGANLFNFQTSAFTFNPGPVFCELLLADEINRTPPKTQAALLEAMQERRVTLDGKSHPLSDRFMVVATQNPLEQQGTYPLPEAQLDRFLFKQVLQYPSREEERAIIASHGLRSGQADPAAMGVEKVADAAWIRTAAETVAQVRLSDEIVDYVLNLVRATRESADLQSGASPRAPPCWPWPPGPGPCWMAVTMRSPMTSRPWPWRACATGSYCRRPLRSKAVRWIRSWLPSSIRLRPHGRP